MMRSYLHDADRRQNDNERLRNWISEIREAAYDSDDVIESYALRGASRRKLTGVLSLIKRYALIINKFIEIHMVGSHVDNVIARISSLTRNLETYGIRPEEGEASNSIYEDIIGVQDDVRILESCLVDPNKCYRVVAICGMGGLGKTTLAKVYHSLDVKSNFESLAWAYISQHCQARDVQEGILFQLISPSLEQRQEIVNMRDEELARMLYQVQEEKSCLVVLDDIWSVDTWKKLSPAFPNGRSPSVVGSKIVLTTRITISSCSKIRPFRKLMIQAIIVLGGLLASKSTFYEWDIVFKNINSYLRREGQEQCLGEVLALSYYELPYRLKPCFLHLAHFPENLEIPTKKLIRIWVAEGIISLDHNQGEGEEALEDVAQRYLTELVERCMIQVVEKSSTGRIRTCQMHNLMRELCVDKAYQENYHVEINSRNVDETRGASRARPTGKVRWIALYLDQDVDRNTVSGREVAKRIDLLIHLRLRSLRNTKIDELPPSIGNLKCLMTLDLLTGNSTVLIPNVIGNMHRMRHLYLPESCEPDQLSSKLVKLKLKGSGLLLDPMPKLEKLPNLRLLELQLDSFMGKKLFCSSNGFPRLKSLIYDLANLEEWKLDKGAMPSLSKLEIANCTKLEKVPDGLRFVTTLQDLEIRSMFAAFRTKLEKGGEDHSLSNMCQLWLGERRTKTEARSWGTWKNPSCDGGSKFLSLRGTTRGFLGAGGHTNGLGMEMEHNLDLTQSHMISSDAVHVVASATLPGFVFADLPD
ncbi:hypothetical protein JHK82_024168 [Glycine max]|nr:hypothetical protein JHK86_024255 [Glycine max]KAG5132980.1 hypothetical protein JHK82_024168 [Glycine max]